MSTKTNLHQSFFSPKRIAFIGASEEGTYPAGIMQNLIGNGYADRVYPVNPKRTHIFGAPCFPSLLDVPEQPDLALLTVPRKAVIPVLKECVTKRVPAALVITAGFGESDALGHALQAEMDTLLREHPLRLIGPNCAGLASLPDHLIATRLSTEILPGPVSFVSQSGALMMSLQGVFADRQIGMSRLVSLGNQADVSLAEMLNVLVDDPETQVITAFLEGLNEGPLFVNAFQRALIAGKPIILLKSGRTRRGMAAAATHTAALAGEDRVFKAICAQFGVILVDDIEPMMDIAELAATFGPGFAHLDSLGFITQSGGMGSLTADWIETMGLNAPPLSETMQTQLHALQTIPDYAVLLNPADVRGASVRGTAVGVTLQTFLDAPDFDSVILLFARSMLTEEAIQTAESVITTAKQQKKPVMVVWSGQNRAASADPVSGVRERFLKAGIPCFDQPSTLLSAIQRLRQYWNYRDIWLEKFSAGRVDGTV